MVKNSHASTCASIVDSLIDLGRSEDSGDYTGHKSWIKNFFQ